MTAEELEELRRHYVDVRRAPGAWVMDPLEVAAAAYEDTMGVPPLRVAWGADRSILIQERPDASLVTITINRVEFPTR